MNIAQRGPQDNNPRLTYFWGLGDLHYRMLAGWHEFQIQRFAPIFSDLQALWQAEGRPDFCVSPGDIVETCALENQILAKTALESQLGGVPFYPGVGNHEYYGPDGEDPAHMAETFTTVWQKPLRYAWQVGGVVCIMLDYPHPITLADPQRVFISQETLAFLDHTLTEYAQLPAVIFLHCPLSDTVLDRDPERQRDFNSLQHFFAPENSQEIRNVLARHRNASLFLSGHTHSGWEAPNLVLTENLGDHPITFVNLMSPWYTGRKTGPHVDTDTKAFTYTSDDPDVLPGFAIHVYKKHITIRVRDHLLGRWVKEWTVPMPTA